MMIKKDNKFNIIFIMKIKSFYILLAPWKFNKLNINNWNVCDATKIDNQKLKVPYFWRIDYEFMLCVPSDYLIVFNQDTIKNSLTWISYSRYVQLDVTFDASE